MNERNDPHPEAPMPTTATTVKDEVIEMLRRLPDNLTLDEIQYYIVMLKKAKQAQQSIENGEVYTNEEARERLKKWLID